MFIVPGSGLFKTCISVMVGTLYKKGDARRDGGFSLFYMGINIGSFIAPLISGWLIKSHGWHWGFGIGDRDAGGADHFPCLCRTVDEAL